MLTHIVETLRVIRRWRDRLWRSFTARLPQRVSVIGPKPLSDVSYAEVLRRAGDLAATAESASSAEVRQFLAAAAAVEYFPLEKWREVIERGPGAHASWRQHVKVTPAGGGAPYVLLVHKPAAAEMERQTS